MQRCAPMSRDGVLIGNVLLNSRPGPFGAYGMVAAKLACELALLPGIAGGRVY